MGWEVIFWNHTPFNLEKLGYKEIKLEGRANAKTDLLKRAKIEAELNYFSRKFKDPVYQTYKFANSHQNLIAKIKTGIVQGLVATHKDEKGLQRLRIKMKSSERKGAYYQKCKEILQEEKPDLVFCTNQRPVNAIAPLTVAQDLKIPTSTFIFSWDNLPKATMVVETDYYFVWSEYMKAELLKYYPQIKEPQVHITGTPQFEPHYNGDLRQSREDFFKEYGLDYTKKYICFSGDDITTSPDDPAYLNDLAYAIKLLNAKGHNLEIIFRRCPVDFSNRYDGVLEKHREIITSIAPIWKKTGDNWNSVLPKKEDLKLQINTILHSELVVNLGSSMVFDFAIFKKPCLYLNYEVKAKTKASWSHKKVYDFVHFRSMPTGKEVFWLNSKEEIPEKLEKALKNPMQKIEKALEWYKKINTFPADKASERIWRKLEIILDQNTLKTENR
ncbi:CDP-glycerol glycerophosphotransferase family protein [Salegentibacter maritimus]|uniref:CDP-glycerol glycerophosphotransferase family protein n=1 Tax=Salegentibacter maritimus TaxID=2794347 RepID=A0ABS0TBZ3_9FLAO|nr:CDP-glycerol glycerophosphotransferase family protein [Salegentibacter maritimus]MBI6118559.1 CDP-glycerol glycerophosphotransferase family protein [Salegentibacter maritimus]